MEFDEAIEVLQDRLIDDPTKVPGELHGYLQGTADYLPSEWSDEDLIEEAETEPE